MYGGEYDAGASQFAGGGFMPRCKHFLPKLSLTSKCALQVVDQTGGVIDASGEYLFAWRMFSFALVSLNYGVGVFCLAVF